VSVFFGARARATEPTSAPASVARSGPFRIGHVKARPTPAIARYVDYYWVTRWDRSGQPPRIATALLDPCVHLQLRNGNAELMGVVRGTYRMRIEGTGCVVGVRFRPGGFYPFVRRATAQWTNRTVPAEEALGTAGGPTEGWAHALWDEIDQCPGGADAHAATIAAHFDAFLGTLLPAHDAVAEEMANLVALLSAPANMRGIGELAQASGRSERTLHRLFLRYVGVSPAWVLRRYRLLAAAERLTAYPPAAVQDLAYELGYADQAHFIRDFRATIGITPGAYVRARE
jgi:AraC-like DNA-binding protein